VVAGDIAQHVVVVEAASVVVPVADAVENGPYVEVVEIVVEAASGLHLAGDEAVEDHSPVLVAGVVRQ